MGSRISLAGARERESGFPQWFYLSMVVTRCGKKRAVRGASPGSVVRRCSDYA